ncbi:MAG: polysaccharide deacetylase family protein [Clostridiales bacterium]|jgi:polysaccharide deacetylase family sporulation protein PdaB|nr:polysaccharide deacetylase family protein [Clostridiales bacterium]
MKFVTLKKRGLAFGFLLVALLALTGSGVYLAGAAPVYLGRTTRKLPIYSVETPEKAVALTFDAAWGADKTERLVATLTQNKVPATFFLVGFWVEEHADKLKLLDKAGIEIGTHSQTHPHMARLTEAQVKEELSTSAARITAAINKPVTLFRAPFGEYSDRVLTVAEGLKLQTIQWDVDTLDWQNLSASEIAARVLNNAKNGSIILMHNDGKYTPEALPLIIEGLRAKGFGFKTVGELVYKEGYTIDHTGRQSKK